MSDDLIYAIIPSYNEQDQILQVIDELNEVPIDLKILVVDDGSKDATPSLLMEKGVEVVKHGINLGQWAALKSGLLIANSESANIVITIDADGQHSPYDIPALISPIVKNQADIVIGTRFLSDSKPEMLTHRYFGIKFLNYLLALRTGKHLSDCTNGFKAIRGTFLPIIISGINENQYGSLEMIINAVSNGARISEVPIKSIHSSKSSKGTLRYAYNLLRTLAK
jgi:glycosyltransferase involved in cell wall biosynthesis